MNAYNIYSLIWLFPIVFMLHDFEEVILFEPWLKHNGKALQTRFSSKLPAFLQGRMGRILNQSTAEFSVSVGLIFLLAVLCTLLAVLRGQYVPFYLAASLFFLHGFMHVGQALLLRKYVPALITSLLIVLPYGVLLFSRLLAQGLLTWPLLILYFAITALLTLPFILGMLIAGEFLYDRMIKALFR